jgi:hypothetical protein
MQSQKQDTPEEHEAIQYYVMEGLFPILATWLSAPRCTTIPQCGGEARRRATR